MTDSKLLSNIDYALARHMGHEANPCNLCYANFPCIERDLLLLAKKLLVPHFDVGEGMVADIRSQLNEAHAAFEAFKNSTYAELTKLRVRESAYDEQTKALEELIQAAGNAGVLLPPSTKEGFEGKVVEKFDSALDKARAISQLTPKPNA